MSNYEMFQVKATITKNIHISCVEQMLDKLKAVGNIENVSMDYFIDDSPRYGGAELKKGLK